MNRRTALNTGIGVLALAGALLIQGADARHGFNKPHPTPTVRPTATPSPTPTPTATPTATPTPTPTGSVVYTFPANGTAAQFTAELSDMSIDVIEMSAGTYHLAGFAVNVDRTARPLTIRPVAGATVVFAGDQTRGGGQFYFGLGGVARYVTLEGVTFDGYSIGDTGIIWAGNASHLTLDDITVRNVTVTGQGSIYSWALYLSRDAGVGTSDIIADRWTVTGVNQNYSALQVIPATSEAHIYARDWHVDGVGYVIFAAQTITDLQLSGWTIANSWRPDVPSWSIRFDSGTFGTMANMTATNSGGVQAWGAMTDGGGNTLP